MLLLLCWLAALAILCSRVTFCQDEKAFEYNRPFEYNCFTNGGPLAHTPNIRDYAIGLQVSDGALHQVMSRIFAIVLREKLNYTNISLVSVQHTTNYSLIDYEDKKYKNIFDRLIFPIQALTMINVAIWMPALARPRVQLRAVNAGSSITPGRFGWFVPSDQVEMPLSPADYSLHYSVFINQSHADYGRYVIPEELLTELRSNKTYESFINPNCVKQTCVTLLAEHRPDTAFVIHYIQEICVNVLWLGIDFREKIRDLHQSYQTAEYRNKRFIVLHFTPSIVIDGDIKFHQITLPHCEDKKALSETLCKYELLPVLKYYDQRLDTDEKQVVSALRKFRISNQELKKLQHSSRWKQSNKISTIEELYNEVACEWLKSNEMIYKQWIETKSFQKTSEIHLKIGGIFPLKDFSRGHQHLEKAMLLAVEAINGMKILKNVKLVAKIEDGKCKADEVLKFFLHYFTQPLVLGVLGPACSEAVEPIASLTKHTSMVVISYSAEGGCFADRQTYPYFFRTIGSNRQYEDVYIELMKLMGWKRVAALTEDGQKYTEYISHMEATMKQHNFELITNKKFLSDVTAAEMNEYLLDLKQKHAKIIIADIHNRNAELVLCEAYHLGMTAYDGYVWFLPSWISKDWKTQHSNKRCTSSQLQKAAEGHFSIMHTPFGDMESMMQENKTVLSWLNSNTKNDTRSNYIGFTYDAVWVYAYAAAKLLEENKDAVHNLRSGSVVARFGELIWDTNFPGLSGHIQFAQDGSRITDLDIVQWRQQEFQPVGKFKPKIVSKGKNRSTDGGAMEFSESKVEWFSGGQRPTDGTYDCSFAALAKFLNMDCYSAASTFTAVMFILVVVFVSLTSFLFWKKRYDNKTKQTSDIMKKFGIDWSSPLGNALDKLDVPRSNVVLNRTLGKGAFGTVLGGMAFIDAYGWTAVAVKTLTSGEEERINFLGEANAMMRLDHKNIVKLLGVCLHSEPIYIIMEFMLYGDLKTYLLARRHLVNEKIAEESDISSKGLTSYAMDVASGLAYLAGKKYVHRDLACRNCLVDAQRVVKLSDFGMARFTHESNYYQFRRKSALPVRWMAPESLGPGMFTPASDIWGFGVILYEIITFGSYPYQWLTNPEVVEYIKSGKTLPIPSGVKPPLEGLMKACWSQEPSKRPTADEVVDYISNYPRLLTPCMDVPSASVQMPENECDMLRLLPKLQNHSLRKRNSTLPQTEIMIDCCQYRLAKQENKEMSTNIKLISSLSNCSNNNNIIQNPAMPLNSTAETTDNGYSIMLPLLPNRMSDSSASSQAKSSEETMLSEELSADVAVEKFSN